MGYSSRFREGENAMTENLFVGLVAILAMALVFWWEFRNSGKERSKLLRMWHESKRAPGWNLPGWTCGHCGVFNGEAKERRDECRSCGKGHT